MGQIILHCIKYRAISLLLDNPPNVGCDTVWTRQKYRRYRLQSSIMQYNSSAQLCAATCRMQPNCSVYELQKSEDNVITCTMAANYDESSYEAVPLVTSFIRKEHTSRIRGTLSDVSLQFCVVLLSPLFYSK